MIKQIDRTETRLSEEQKQMQEMQSEIVGLKKSNYHYYLLMGCLKKIKKTNKNFEACIFKRRKKLNSLAHTHL